MRESLGIGDSVRTDWSVKFEGPLVGFVDFAKSKQEQYGMHACSRELIITAINELCKQ